MNVMIQQPAGVATLGQPQAYNPYAIPGQTHQPQAYNPYGQPQPGVAPSPYAAPAVQPQAYNPYAPTTPSIPGVAVPAMAQPGYNPAVAPNPYAPASPYTPGVTPYAPQPVAQPNYGVPGMMQPAHNPAPQIPGVGLPQAPSVPGYNPYAPTAPAVQPQAYNPYAPAPAAPAYNPYAPAAPTAPGLPQAYNPYGPGMPTYNPYTTVQPQSNYSQNGIPSESEHIYNFLYSSSKTKEEIVDYIKNRDPFYSSQENGDITIYSTNIGIYFVCNNTITNSNFLEAVLKSALIRNYRILDNGYVAFISEIAISCTESITRDSIISFAKYLCEKNYLLTLRKEQFIFTKSGNLIFIDFSSLIPKEYMMGLEKYLYSPSGGVLYQEPSILFNNVDCLFIDILEKKYFKRNEIIEIEKRITNFNQLKRSVCR